MTPVGSVTPLARILSRFGVSQAVEELSQDDREWVEERAAMLEFDGGQPRAAAKAAAWEEWRARGHGPEGVEPRDG